MSIVLDPNAIFAPLYNDPAAAASGYLQAQGAAHQRAAAQNAQMEFQQNQADMAGWGHLLGTGLTAGAGAAIGGAGLLGSKIGAGGGALLGLGAKLGLGGVANAAVGHSLGMDEMAAQQTYQTGRQEAGFAHDESMANIREQRAQALQFQQDYGIDPTTAVSQTRTAWGNGTPEQKVQMADLIGMKPEQVDNLAGQDLTDAYQRMGGMANKGLVLQQHAVAAGQQAAAYQQAKMQGAQDDAQTYQALNDGGASFTSPSAQASLADLNAAEAAIDDGNFPPDVANDLKQQVYDQKMDLMRKNKSGINYKQSPQQQFEGMIVHDPKTGKAYMMHPPRAMKVTPMEEKTDQPMTWTDMEKQGKVGTAKMDDGSEVLWAKDDKGVPHYHNPPKPNAPKAADLSKIATEIRNNDARFEITRTPQEFGKELAKTVVGINEANRILEKQMEINTAIDQPISDPQQVDGLIDDIEDAYGSPAQSQEDYEKSIPADSMYFNQPPNVKQQIYQSRREPNPAWKDTPKRVQKFYGQLQQAKGLITQARQQQAVKQVQQKVAGAVTQAAGAPARDPQFEIDAIKKQYPDPTKIPPQEMARYKQLRLQMQLRQATTQPSQ